MNSKNSHPLKVKRPSNSRGRATLREPGTRCINSTINCTEISRACDAFFISRNPAYVPRRIGTFSAPVGKTA